METFKQRLKRFTIGSIREIPLNLLGSIENYPLLEIRKAKEQKLDNLIFLGTHAIIQIIVKYIFGKSGFGGTKFYLENFVDGSADDTRFSLISDDIHEMRNVMAHQLMSSNTHNIAINYKMSEGWKLEPDLLHINQNVYAEHFLNGFDRDGRIWDWDKFVTEDQLISGKYKFLVEWLRLNKKHPITLEIKKLETLDTQSAIQTQEEKIKNLIFKEYDII